MVLLRRHRRCLKYVIIIAIGVILLPMLLQSNTENPSRKSGVVAPDHVRSRPDIEVPDIPGLHQAASIMKPEYHLVDTDPRKIFGFDAEKTAKKDWHNFKQIEEEAKRTGPGEQGLAYRMQYEKSKMSEFYRTNGFNAHVSDQIALNRSVKDVRPEGCKKKEYIAKLPTVSVIMPFHDEHWSTLLRSVYSIIDRSPPDVLKEVILADDFSTKSFLKSELDEYIKLHWPGKVKVVRAEKREGLIRARLMGARVATGQVILFLDSHSECNTNWLPPLLEPIAFDYKTVVCPFVDVVDYETYEYRPQDLGARGAFDWELYYKRLPLLEKDLKNPTEPFDDPVMAGGYFAISQKWFWELGGYDEGLDIWGGEQYELSFKIWQCGGRMVDAPCSHVGHIYRKFAPHTNPGVGDFVGRNYKRVAEVWMDEYKEFIYMRRPHYRNLNPGDLTKQKALREQLKCKPFKWFMESVAFDLTKKYPVTEPPDGAKGEIRNLASNLCVDTQYKRQMERFELQPCIKDGKGRSGEQSFIYGWHKDIRPTSRTMCFDVSEHTDHSPVMLFQCHNMGGNQEWKLRPGHSWVQLFHPVGNMCMDCDPERREIFMAACDARKQSQRWVFEHIDLDVIKRWQ